ncbi:LOW QUALITY PROTEIN: protein kinase PINOID-like [Rutidosis leptorrhynchoides]|uniref:LOW QUALITY PROTEIN: protein kinase PINOID-like n=1 Tax=Rutidosis leptorrhynchoides TaxID=125765 RepID=UPI003A992D51
MLLESNRVSDSELSLESTTVNSSQSLSSMRSSTVSNGSFSRLSFDLTTTTGTSPPEYDHHHLAIKPHRSSSDSAYAAIRRRHQSPSTAPLTFRDFRLLKKIGAGDIGTVYLCRLAAEVNDVGGCSARGGINDDALYAMKVVDKEALKVKKKTHRAEMEKKILKMLDHPFLPTMYAQFEASNFSCIVMEFCSGGDLHSLRHKQVHKRFSLNSARFYAAEVLVALEYLHMLGIIYRDLKPENVLVRSDGHIMLSDFDLSLCSDAIVAVESPSLSPDRASPRYTRRPSNKTTPFSCLGNNRLFRSKKIQTLTNNASSTNRLFVAEPVTARSQSFVGTHEYVTPEVASGLSHGNAVDWWAFGIFVYEMIYGRTPFAAPSNEATLRNIVKKPLTFPTPSPSSMLEVHARDLISGLLNKDPNNRLGSKRGSADVKTHPFFKGLNFALVRSVTPPEIPGLRRVKTMPYCQKSQQKKRSSQSGAFDYF